MGRTKNPWPFDIPADATVVTSLYVTKKKMPILEVSHMFDEEEGALWQFHCGNSDYEESVLQLIRLDEILKLDAGLMELATLPVGFCAKRASVRAPWKFEKEES